MTQFYSRVGSCSHFESVFLSVFNACQMHSHTVSCSVFAAGEGPVLKAYSLQPHPKACTSLTVLQHSRIHGIRPRAQAAVPAQCSAAGVHGTVENGL